MDQRDAVERRAGVIDQLDTFVFFLDEGLDRDVTVRIVPTNLELPRA